MATVSQGRGWVLEHSRPLRLFTLFILYVGQGMPIGLFWFAIPAWMAVNGATAADVGSVAALTALPWSLKLFNGFFMDRYTYLPMGRRRAWILGAQGVMILTLVVAALLNPSALDVAVLGAIGFTVNLATTFQDVAVDGLAVDIMTEDERARGSGMMFGGQSIGIAAATAITGFVIEDFGAPAAYLCVAAIIFALCVYIASFTERDGERRMPWNEGVAHERNVSIQLDAWWPLLKSTFLSLFKGISILWIIVAFSTGILYGGATGASPLIGANYVGWDVSTISAHTAAAGLIGGVLCMTLGGWLGDNFGAKRIGIVWIAAIVVMCTGMYLSEPSWGSAALFIAFLYGWTALNVLRTVALLPIPMRLCDPKVAATQFTIYMAISNFGISFGAYMLSLSDKMGGLPSIFVIIGAGHLLALILMVIVKFPRRPEYYAKQANAALMFEGESVRKEKLEAQ